MHSIKKILESDLVGTDQTIKGWVRYFRNDRFIIVNDGSTVTNLQCVIDRGQFGDDVLSRISTGAAVECIGTIVASSGAGQALELKVDSIRIIGDSDADRYPLQPKKHSMEFMRENGHLRMRTNIYSAVFRIRHLVSFAVHRFFHEKGYFWMHTPIITASDAEGAGEMFRVTTLDPKHTPIVDGEVDWKQDFFGTPAHLTVSGQLQGELAATALGKVYTFGPTFRAENSNTARHLAEFWMVEPETAFMDIHGNMDLAEEMCHYIIREVYEKGGDDILFLQKHLKEEEAQLPQAYRSEYALMDKLMFVLKSKFARVTYTDAIYILLNSKKKFEFPVQWGMDLQSEHERYLVEKHFKCPVIVTGYPAKVKAFYMRLNEPGDLGYTEHGPTVAAMDILFPGIGEVIGGSQREERLEVLETRMDDMGVSREELKWYLDTRRFGSVPHSGFGLGLERMMMFVTGMSNVRDVIPFPRTPNNAQF